MKLSVSTRPMLPQANSLGVATGETTALLLAWIDREISRAMERDTPEGNAREREPAQRETLLAATHAQSWGEFALVRLAGVEGVTDRFRTQGEHISGRYKSDAYKFNQPLSGPNSKVVYSCYATQGKAYAKNPPQNSKIRVLCINLQREVKWADGFYTWQEYE